MVRSGAGFVNMLLCELSIDVRCELDAVMLYERPHSLCVTAQPARVQYHFSWAHFSRMPAVHELPLACKIALCISAAMHMFSDY